MLRLISVIGIAIAMVIGFVALSTKMKDDYSIRSQVVSVFKQMKTLAADELQCQSKQQPTENQTHNNLENSNKASVEMDAEVELTPLSEEQASVDSEMQSSEESSAHISANLETDNSTEEASTQSPDTAENVEVENNADIIKTMGYRILDTGSVEVITIFNAIKGESGKAQIKADSRVVINCQCDSEKMYCKTVESNINKNYLPKMLSKQ